MHSRMSRRSAMALTAVALLGAAGSAALAQTTHGGSRGRGGGGGRGSGGGDHTSGGGHTPGAGEDDHSHDDTEHTDDGHEEHDPDTGTDHADGKRGPRYRGGRASEKALGRGYGRSLEDRVLSGD